MSHTTPFSRLTNLPLLSLAALLATACASSDGSTSFGGSAHDGGDLADVVGIETGADAGSIDAPADGSGGGGDAAADVVHEATIDAAAPAGDADYPFEVEPNDSIAQANAVAAGTKGFTAWIPWVGDVDYFSIVVPEGGRITVDVGDGQGACPGGIGPLTRIYRPNGVLLAQDTDSGPDNCSHLGADVTADVANLAAGTYYVSVKDFADDQTIPFYRVAIRADGPGCGDTILQGGEQCDDGNVLDGDGCSAGCQVETIFTLETEPNDTTAQASTKPAASPGFAGALPTGSDVDTFAVEVTVAGASVRAETMDLLGTGVCPANADTALYFYDASGSELAYDDDGGADFCSLLDPASDAALTNLAVGTYYVQVVSSFGDPVAHYGVKIAVALPGCGDRIVQTGEQCDDGNAIANDGCSPSCTFDTSGPGDICPGLDFPLSGSGSSARVGVLSATTSGFVDQYVPSCSSSGGRDVVYAITPDVSGHLSVTGSAGYSVVLSLRSSCDVASSELDCSAPGTTVGVVAAPVTAGTPVYVFVDGASGASGAVTLTATLVPAGCPNGFVDPGEQCDDGNGVATDGCDASCKLSPALTSESEPNDTRPTANKLATPGGFLGAIDVVGDRDWYSFDIAASGASLRAETFTGGTSVAPTCPFGDTEIHLVSPSGIELGSDDDSGVSLCSLIDPAVASWATNLPAGTYYVWVQRHNDSETIASYALALSLQ